MRLRLTAKKLDTAFAQAGSVGLAPSTTNPDFLPGRMQTWNVNVERQIGPALGVMAGYFGSKGDRLRITRNINQPVNGVRPYPTLSPTSPISPGATLGNILEVQSAGWSHYKGLWLTANRRMSNGLQLSSSYTLSKSTVPPVAGGGGVVKTSIGGAPAALRMACFSTSGSSDPAEEAVGWS